jgi:hypothetical protein
MLDVSPGVIVPDVIASGIWLSGMRKIFSIIRHLVCIARKLRRRQDLSWHWQHILREFGVGRYSLWGSSSASRPRALGISKR